MRQLTSARTRRFLLLLQLLRLARTEQIPICIVHWTRNTERKAVLQQQLRSQGLEAYWAEEFDAEELLSPEPPPETGDGGSRSLGGGDDDSGGGSGSSSSSSRRRVRALLSSPAGLYDHFRELRTVGFRGFMHRRVPLRDVSVALKHHACLAHISATAHPLGGVVLEDDAQLAPAFATLLHRNLAECAASAANAAVAAAVDTAAGGVDAADTAAAGTGDGHCDILCLGSALGSCEGIVECGEARSAAAPHVYRKRWWRGHYTLYQNGPYNVLNEVDSYAVSLSTARRLAATMRPVFMPANEQLNYHANTMGLAVFWSDPPFVTQGTRSGRFASWRRKKKTQAAAEQRAGVDHGSGAAARLSACLEHTGVISEPGEEEAPGASEAAVFREALALHPTHPGYHRTLDKLGTQLMAQGLLAEAGTSFAAAITAGPGDAEALSNFGALRFREARYVEACCLFERAAALARHGEQQRMCTAAEPGEASRCAFEQKYVAAFETNARVCRETRDGQLRAVVP